jgi:hypothetical protein
VFFTVPRVIKSLAAISGFVKPLAASAATSRSLCERACFEDLFTDALID